MTIKKSHIFLLSCLSFIFGAGLASFLPLEYWHYQEFVWLLCVIALAVLIIFWKNRYVKTAALLGLFLFLGITRFGSAIPVDFPDRISHYRGREVKLEARVSDWVVSKLDKQQLEVEALELKNKNKKVSGKVLVTTRLYPEYDYGEKILLTGELQRPPDFPDFAYSRYLAKSDIYTVSYYPGIEKRGEAPLDWGQKIRQRVFSFKNRAISIINKGLGEPQAALVKAMVLGDKSMVPQGLKEDFSRAGISHITAISGMHIGILAALIFYALLALGLHRRYVFWLSAFLLVFYIIMIGAPASAVRAGTIGILVLLSFNLGRFYRIENLLALAAAVMLVVNPKLLRDDLGFQLSFLAVAGIWYFYPKLNNFFQRIHQNRPVAKLLFDIFNITLCAQALTLPLIAYNFSHIAVVAPVANLLVLWTLPLVLVFSLSALAIGALLPHLVWWWFLPVNILTSYIHQAGEVLGNWSWGHIPIHLSLWWWLFYYLVLGWLVFDKSGIKDVWLNFGRKNSKLKERL
ncbi:MAG TPA: ComEC/Rec2 family competence protein [Patescibacteria group bacterium]|nr:ComEC/Rec2 family competence protein [Patescibacteria group bacterium]